MKKKQKLFVHTILENPSIKRRVSFYVPENTVNLMIRLHRKPIIRVAKSIVKVLLEYEDFKNYSENDLEKKLYEVETQ